MGCAGQFRWRSTSVSKKYVPLPIAPSDSARPGEPATADDAEEFYVNEILKPDHEQDWVAGVDRWRGPLPPIALWP